MNKVTVPNELVPFQPVLMGPSFFDILARDADFLLISIDTKSVADYFQEHDWKAQEVETDIHARKDNFDVHI